MAKTVLSRKSKVVLAFEKKKKRTLSKPMNSAVQAVVSTATHVARVVQAIEKTEGQGRAAVESGYSLSQPSTPPELESSGSDTREAGEALPEDSEREIDLTPGELSKTDDPVRLYLREMGSVSLLSREGEIELAKRIEDGKHELAFAIAGMPMTLTYLDALRLAIKKGDLRVQDLVLVHEPTEEEGLEEEDVEDDQDEEELLQHTLAELEKMRRVGKSLLTLYDKRRKAPSAQQTRIEKQIHAVQQQIVERLDAMNVQPTRQSAAHLGGT